MEKRIFGSDRITINGLYTFKKSDISGIYSKHYSSVAESKECMKLFILINGNSIEIDSSPYDENDNSLYSRGTSQENQLKVYHRKWEEHLNTITNDKSKKERKTI